MTCGLVIMLIAVRAAGQCDPEPINQCTGGGPDCSGGLSPIVINFAIGGYRLTGADAPVLFDIRDTGQPIWIGWTAAGADEAFLCLDRNHDGKIDTGAELFGNATILKNGNRAPNGFIALAEYDDNHDGVIDDRDAIWSQLLLWRDLNHDGISQAEEITRVADSPLKSIALDYHWTGRRDSSGNTLRYESKIGVRDAAFQTVPRPVYDVYFAPVTHGRSGPDQQATTGGAGVGSEASRRDEAMRLLASEPLEVVRTYELLVSKDKPDRLRIYSALPSSMKAAMWSHQLLTALAQHPEFTEEQRTVLYDALDLFSPKLFEMAYQSPDWSARIDQPLRRIEQRARAAFGPVLAGKLFAQLGPLSATTAAQETQGASQSPSERNAALPESQPPPERSLPAGPETSVALAESAWPADLSLLEGEAARTYAALLERNASERRGLFRELPNPTKSAVWIHQLRSALQAHPEFTTAQRAVILKTLSLLTPDFFDIDSSNPHWTDRVDEPLRELMAQAKAAFGAKMVRELFGELGPNEVRSTGTGAIQKGLPPWIGRPSPTDTTPTCTCNTWSDFCGSDSSCTQGGCYFTNTGCGFLWQYACVGLCVPHDPPYG